MKKIDLAEIKTYTLSPDRVNEKVSAASTYWHLDHLLQVVISIGKSLIKSNPEDYKSKFSTSWAYIKTTGKIPRGVGKAPAAVTPGEDIKQETLIMQIEIAGSILDRVHTLPKKAHFHHPYFGVLDLKNALKFMSIHSNHHLKIIQEINA